MISPDEQAERVEAEQFNDCADDEPASRASGDDPGAVAGQREASRDTGSAKQGDEDRDAQQDENDRGRAHARLERLRGPDEAVEKPADEAGYAAADGPGDREDQRALPGGCYGPSDCPRRLVINAIHRRDEAVTVLGHRLDEARAGGIVPELASQRPNALGERFVGDRDSTPHLVEEAILGDELALFADQQRQGVEIAAVEFDRFASAPQLAIVGIEHELLKDEASGHFSAKPHPLLMPFTGVAGTPTMQSCMERHEWQQMGR